MPLVWLPRGHETRESKLSQPGNPKEMANPAWGETSSLLWRWPPHRCFLSCLLKLSWGQGSHTPPLQPAQALSQPCPQEVFPEHLTKTSWLQFKPITACPTLDQLISIIFITAFFRTDECYTSYSQLSQSWSTNQLSQSIFPGACFQNSVNSLNLSESFLELWCQSLEIYVSSWCNTSTK